VNWERLQRQIEFTVEIDKIKNIVRYTRKIADPDNYENDAEHSWHLAVMALFLKEHANEEVNITRVLKMVLIHDLVEIDAGDTFAYDYEGMKDKKEREEKAAQRIFSILPDDQHDEFTKLWREFEERETPEAKFATALDRLQPLIHNYFTDGQAWLDHEISADQVIERNEHIRCGSEKLWEYAESIIEDSVEKGYLKSQSPECE